MKRLFLFLFVFCSGIAFTQTFSTEFQEYRNKVKAEFNEYKNRKHTEFENYRKVRNEEFAVYLATSWKDYMSFSAKTLKNRSKPVAPVIYDEQDLHVPSKLPVSQVISPPSVIQDVPLSIAPPISPGEKKNLYRFLFYGTACYMHYIPDENIGLENLTEESVSKCWKQLSKDKYATLIDDCVRLKSELNLCDWGYVKLVETVSAHLFPGLSDFQAVVSTYLLVQSGYDVRLCRMGQSLQMLIHSSDQLFQLNYYIINGKKYYPTHPIKQGQCIQTYPDDFSVKCIPVRMLMNKYPNFDTDIADRYTYVSSSWKEVAPFRISVNPAVIRFYKDYPQCEWNLYGQAALSPEFKKQVLPFFQRLLIGKSQLEAVGLLINYVQYGFSYKTDHDQFGYEKPFFVDENFYYPFNDCEDRSILFASLVKELLKMDVVYLYYPNHLATAVFFSDSVEGDSVMVAGKRYIVCDPTYIGAPIGQAMPCYKSVAAKVIFID